MSPSISIPRNKTSSGCHKRRADPHQFVVPRHGPPVPSAYLCQPLGLVAFLCINSLQQQTSDPEDTRSTLFLVVKGLRDQPQSFT